MAETNPHVVRQGEHLHELAVRYGTEVADIWALSENQRLKDEGRTPEQLVAGDVVYIPVVKRKVFPAQIGQENRFKVNLPTTEVTVKLQGDDHKALANVAFEIPRLRMKGMTDGAGNIRLKQLPHSTKVLHVHLTEKNVTLEVRVGDLDPVTTASGKAQRLAHLGYLPGEGDDATDEKLLPAYASFCAQHAPDAKTDADKEKALSNLHGS